MDKQHTRIQNTIEAFVKLTVITTQQCCQSLIIRNALKNKGDSITKLTHSTLAGLLLSYLRTALQYEKLFGVLTKYTLQCTWKDCMYNFSCFAPYCAVFNCQEIFEILAGSAGTGTPFHWYFVSCWCAQVLYHHTNYTIRTMIVVYFKTCQYL